MKVKYIGKEKMDFIISDNFIDLIPGKIYNVLDVSKKNWVLSTNR